MTVRAGDNGTVGGQTLVALLAIKTLLKKCEARGIKVAVWPFDGLSIADGRYQGAHVMIEPYPTAVRSADIVQTDDSDALASAGHIRDADLNGTLRALLDLSGLALEQAKVVAVEGWIASHRPATKPRVTTAGSRRRLVCS